MSLRDGDPLPCPCGATLVVIWQEPTWSGPIHQKVRSGQRFFYRCDRCRREVDMRWLERNVKREPRSTSHEPRGGTA